ncbi:hypothetical protein L6452_43337 [Arctium lappa]|uniref:Uncharacterized protein n=1 Tax=Arctium lappa TaxID=4217 RepID=A0ACB8XL37_ARCLA|nr:hypothetical protein L6452_43337 [Arctium lappa]
MVCTFFFIILHDSSYFHFIRFKPSSSRCNVLDEMGERISELEQSINDLRAEMGAEGSPPPAAPSKKPDEG